MRIAVSLGGKPATGVRVEFYIYGTQQEFFEAQSDGNGIVVTPELAEKDYNVFAVLDKDVGTSEWVRVVRKHEASTIPLDLTEANYQAHPELSLEAYNGTQEPVHDRLQTFEGFAADVSGAPVTDTKIVVLKMGAPYKNFALVLKPNGDGHFAAQLSEGSYIVYFFSTGFKTVRKTFAITKDGSGSLNVALTPGSC